MATSAAARRTAEAPARERTSRAPLAAARPATRVRRRPAQGRWLQTLVIFVICLSVLAAGRVAMSFAVVQKTVATNAVAQEEQQVAAENAQLKEELTELDSVVRIRKVGEKKLGMVEPEHKDYLTIAPDGSIKAGARP